jgi:hypothetical protein
MTKSVLAALFSLLIILLPPWAFSQETSEKKESLKPGYVEVVDVVWKEAQGKPNHPQRGRFSVYVPKYGVILEPDKSGSGARHDLLAGQYEAVAYSTKGKFNSVVTFRDHSPYHKGVVSNTYYLEYFSFKVEADKVTKIRGYINPYKSGNLHEHDEENSGGYTAYWEPRIERITKETSRQ